MFKQSLLIAPIVLTQLNIQAAQKPNIILVLADDLGWSDLGCYGSTFYETPRLDRLAANGLRFTQAYSNGTVCSPSRAALLTGKYPVKSDVTDYIPGRQNAIGPEAFRKLVCQPFAQQLALEDTTIAETLKSAGYRTASIGKWHLGKEKYYPQHQGFDLNIGGADKGGPYGGKGYFYPFGAPGVDGKEGDFLTDRLTDEAIQFAKLNRDTQFFIYLSHYAVHNPIMAPDTLVKKFQAKSDQLAYTFSQRFDTLANWVKDYPESMRKNFKIRKVQDHPSYAALLANLDYNIGRLVDSLEILGLMDNTIIVFTSDNGGLSTSEGANTCNTPLRAGKGWMYEGGIRVPAFVYYPGKIKMGMVSDQVISGVDIYPTFLELAGISTNQQNLDGISITKVWEGQKLQDRPIFWHYPHYSNQGASSPFSIVRLGNLKLIEFHEDNHYELYNLNDDLGETQDLFLKQPEEAMKMKQLLDNWKKTTGAKMPLSKQNN